ncbi:MAG TPA: hypothetical protein VKS60_01785, partial [Stellaceae bacterium]|nr:hypothetical protein [Stellaceae bacterium]
VLDAMNPVTWYRDVTGTSKNDTAPDAANAANLEAGSKEPYPDLGSVPNEPSRGLTEDQKAQLAQGLIADRDNARYTDQQIRGGNAGATVQSQTPVPEESLPFAGGANAAPNPTPDPTPNATSPHPPGQPTQPTMNPQSPTAAPAPPKEPVAATREAGLATPEPRGTPQPQNAAPAPPAPTLPPLPPPQPEQPFQGAPPGHPEPPPGPTQVAGVPVPPQAPVRNSSIPASPSVVPAPNAAPTAAAGPIGRLTRSAAVGEVDFTAGSKDVPANAGETLGKVPGLHKQYGGIVRIVAYAPPADSGSDPSGSQLAAYQAALDRANAVKQALVTAGMPAAEIVAEADRMRGSGPPPDRADIYVEY